MRQTLFHIPETIFGQPLAEWGILLLIVAVLLSHVYQYIMHRKISGIGSSLVLLAIGTVLLVFVIPNLAEAGRGIPIRGYGVCLVVAIFAALALVLHLAKQQNIAAEEIYGLCFWTVIIGIIGARVFYVTEYWQEMLRFDHSGKLLLQESFFRVINFAQGGLTVFGSIIGGILAALIFMLRNGMPVFRTFDMMAPAAILGIAIGRIGCLLNGCCFGGIAETSWAIVFPPGSPAHTYQVAHGNAFIYGLKFEERTIGKQKFLAVAEVLPDSDAESQGIVPNMVLRHVVFQQEGNRMIETPHTQQDAAELLTYLQRTKPHEKIHFDFFTDSLPHKVVSYYLTPGTSVVLPVHPTQIYSSILALLLCGTLLLLRRLRFYQEREGLLLASFMILYSVGRFIIEIVRTDEDAFLGTGMTISQNVSIVFGTLGMVLFVYLIVSKNRRPGRLPPCPSADPKTE